jgi:glycosyltransferase involved in cell wall biosynthesis
MASSVPFIAFDAGNIGELPGGLVVESTREMANKIDELLSDSSRRRHLGRVGQAEQRRSYDWAVVVPLYLKLFEELRMVKKSRL